MANNLNFLPLRVAIKVPWINEDDSIPVCLTNILDSNFRQMIHYHIYQADICP